MLWYKSWLETRWRFLIGLALLMLSACGTVLTYPEVVRAAAAGAAGRSRAARSAGASRRPWSCRALPRLRLVAVVPPEHAADVGALRGAARHRRPALARRPAAGRCSRCRCRCRATGCSAFAPRPGWRNCWCSPSSRRSSCRCSRRPSGRRYSLGDALVHAACLFVAGTVFFSLTFLLSTVFSDVWRPVLIALCVAMVLALVEQVFR